MKRRIAYRPISLLCILLVFHVSQNLSAQPPESSKMIDRLIFLGHFPVREWLYEGPALIEFECPTCVSEIDTIKVDATTRISSFVYDQKGRIVVLQAGTESRETVTYDLNGMITRLGQSWEDGRWKIHYKSQRLEDAYRDWTYFAEGSVENDSTWRVSARVETEFDSLGRRILRKYENNFSQPPEKQQRRYSYNTNGSLAAIVDENWQNSAWVALERTAFEYDSTEKRVRILLQGDSLGAWRNSRCSEVYISPEQTSVVFLNMYWNGSQWLMSDREIYAYRADGRRDSLRKETWSESGWRIWSRHAYHYGFDNLLYSDEREDWNNEIRSNAIRQFYRYDATGNLIEWQRSRWQDTAWVPWGFPSRGWEDNKRNLYGFFSGSPIIIIYKSRPNGFDSRNNGITQNYSLHQNYPNPFNPTTTIEYEIPESAFVTLRVFDVLGREVTTLVNAQQSPGKHTRTFDASRFASGVYFNRLEARTLNGVPLFTQLKKLVVTK